MTADTLAGLKISSNTTALLRAYADMLVHWSKTINLISPQSVPDLWERHIADSAQVFAAAPDARLWVDLGSGGGLPAVVCAILAQEKQPDCRFVLIESDKRKATFLRSVARELGLSFKVLSERVEAAPPQGADVVSARALAPLVHLLPMVHRHLMRDGVALLPKGKSFETELAVAAKEWDFEVTALTSQTDPEARVLVMKNIIMSEAY